MKLFVLLGALFFLPGLVFGQTMVKGYIINEKGDTLKGEIKINTKKEHEAYNKVFFKDATGAQKNYKPEKARGYGYEGKRFISIEWAGEFNFYLLLAEGNINFYKVMAETVRMNESVYEEEYFVKKEGDKEISAIKKSKFKKLLTDLMKDEPEIAASYGDEKEFNAEKACEVIRQYNTRKSGN